MQNIKNKIEKITNLFELKASDYGLSWRLLRPNSMNDQLRIKVKRLRTIQQPDYKPLVDETQEDAFMALFNYSIMAIINLRLGFTDGEETDVEQAISDYKFVVSEVVALMEKKNSDYGEAWKDLSVQSITDLIYQKVLRAKSIIGNGYKVQASESIEGSYMDIANYSVFALIHLETMVEESVHEYVERSYPKELPKKPEIVYDEGKELPADEMEAYLNKAYPENPDGGRFIGSKYNSPKNYGPVDSINKTQTQKDEDNFLVDYTSAFIEPKLATEDELLAGTEKTYIPENLIKLSEKAVGEVNDYLTKMIADSLAGKFYKFLKHQLFEKLILGATPKRFRFIGCFGDEKTKLYYRPLKNGNFQIIQDNFGDGKIKLYEFKKIDSIQKFLDVSEFDFDNYYQVNAFLKTDSDDKNNYFLRVPDMATREVEPESGITRSVKEPEVKKPKYTHEQNVERVYKFLLNHRIFGIDKPKFDFDSNKNATVDYGHGLISNYIGKAGNFHTYYVNGKNDDLIVILYSGSTYYVINHETEYYGFGDAHKEYVREFTHIVDFINYMETVKLQLELIEDKTSSPYSGLASQVQKLDDKKLQEYINSVYSNNPELSVNHKTIIDIDKETGNNEPEFRISNNPVLNKAVEFPIAENIVNNFDERRLQEDVSTGRKIPTLNIEKELLQQKSHEHVFSEKNLTDSRHDENKDDVSDYAVIITSGDNTDITNLHFEFIDLKIHKIDFNIDFVFRGSVSYFLEVAHKVKQMCAMTPITLEDFIERIKKNL